MAMETPDIFGPALVMPEQFFGADESLSAVSGERRLMLAVLEDAVFCYQSYALSRDARRKFEFSEAKSWIENDDRDWPFSFENICAVLGFDPECLRSGLREQIGASNRLERSRIDPHIMPLEARRRQMALQTAAEEREHLQQDVAA